MTREDFLARLQREGYAEIVTVERAANGELDEHTHPFAALALILDGEIEIRCAGERRLYRAGDIFRLAAETLHSERYGPAGVRYLVGRK